MASIQLYSKGGDPNENCLEGSLPANEYRKIRRVNDNDELAALRRDVQYLKDRTAIFDCIARHARGHDRHDSELLTSCYHSDGYDEHGYAINSGPDYAKWANPQHAAGSQNHQHHVTTHNCEIDGDVAHCESYVLVALLNHDGQTARFISGRYIDRLEKRADEWKLVVRRSTVEVMLMGDASILNSPQFKDLGYPRGTRDKRDLSYARPLELDTKSPELW